MSIEIGILRIAAIINTDNYDGIYDCISRVVNGFYYDTPSAFETHKHVKKYFHNVVDEEYLHNLKNLMKLPILNMVDLFIMLDFLRSRPWSPKLYKILDELDSSITQENFNRMCDNAKNNKKHVVNAIISDEIITILSRNAEN